MDEASWLKHIIADTGVAENLLIISDTLLKKQKGKNGNAYGVGPTLYATYNITNLGDYGMHVIMHDGPSPLRMDPLKFIKKQSTRDDTFAFAVPDEELYLRCRKDLGDIVQEGRSGSGYACVVQTKEGRRIIFL